MKADKVTSILSRLFLSGAFVLIALAVSERMGEFLGYTITRPYYTAGRLVEFSTMLLVFVVALLLRQIREELKWIRWGMGKGPS